MDDEQNIQKILEFLGQCTNGSANAINIANFLGLHAPKYVFPLLGRMKSEGMVSNDGFVWQLSRADSPSRRQPELTNAEERNPAASSPVSCYLKMLIETYKVLSRTSYKGGGGVSKNRRVSHMDIPVTYLHSYLFE